MAALEYTGRKQGDIRFTRATGWEVTVDYIYIILYGTCLEQCGRAHIVEMHASIKVQ